MEMKQLAARLELNLATVYRLKKRGMPTSSVAAAERWREKHLNPEARLRAMLAKLTWAAKDR
jgi:transposase